MVLLILARLLVRWVALHRWRGTLGRVGEAAVSPCDPGYGAVSRSVVAAARRLPGDFVCLPRAMAVQWMLRRRGLASALVFGVSPQAKDDGLHALHAWVEGGGRIVIGEDQRNQYARGLVLVQP
jgi:hypothetical protein